MPLRDVPTTLDEQIADIYEKLRRLQTFRSGVSGTIVTTTVTDPSDPSAPPSPSATLTFDDPVASLFGDANAQGSDTDAARADHVHDRRDDAVLFHMLVSP